MNVIFWALVKTVDIRGLFRMYILLVCYSAKSANSAVFRIPVPLETEIISVKSTVFRRLSILQTPKRMRLKTS